MKPWTKVAEDRAPDGGLVEVFQRDEEYSLRIGNKVLMTSRTQGSEVQLAHHTLSAMEKTEQPRVLIGGLGFGYTLRAALDVLPPGAQVFVVELMPFVVELNRGVLGNLAAHPLSDARVSIIQADIVQYFQNTKQVYDAILLDVDNGPQAFTQDGNGWLYRQPGLKRLRRLLTPGGALGVWSVAQDDRFTGQLGASGFATECHTVRARLNGKGDRHVVWVARRGGGAAS